MFFLPNICFFRDVTFFKKYLRFLLPTGLVSFEFVSNNNNKKKHVLTEPGMASAFPASSRCDTHLGVVRGDGPEGAVGGYTGGGGCLSPNAFDEGKVFGGYIDL